MQARTLLNGGAVSYLIHGQPFTLEIEATGCLFVVIRCDSGRSPIHKWAVRRRHTLFSGLTNSFDPLIQVWGVGWGFKKIFEKRLRVNYIDVIDQDLSIQIPRAASVSGMGIIPSAMGIEGLSVNIREGSSMPLFPRPIQTLVKPMRIRLEEDWESGTENSIQINPS